MNLLEVLNLTSSGNKSEYKSGLITLSTPSGPKESIFVSVNDKYVKKLTVTNADSFRVITENDNSKLVSVESLLADYANLVWEEIIRQEE